MSIPFNKLPWLNLSFKPDGDADITYDLTTSKKSKNMVKVMFRANPKPTSGIWWIGSKGKLPGVLFHRITSQYS